MEASLHSQTLSFALDPSKRFGNIGGIILPNKTRVIPHIDSQYGSPKKLSPKRKCHQSLTELMHEVDNLYYEVMFVSEMMRTGQEMLGPSIAEAITQLDRNIPCETYSPTGRKTNMIYNTSGGFDATKDAYASQSHAVRTRDMDAMSSRCPVEARYVTLSNWKFDSSEPEVLNIFIKVVENIILREGLLLRMRALCENLESQYWKYAVLRINAMEKKRPLNIETLVSKRKYIKSLQLELSIGLAHLRGISVDILESIVYFRRVNHRHVPSRETVTIFWKNYNYILKMKSDCDFLNDYVTIRMWLGFTVLNCLLLPDDGPSRAKDIFIQRRSYFHNWLLEKTKAQKKKYRSMGRSRSGLLASDNEDISSVPSDATTNAITNNPRDNEGLNDLRVADLSLDHLENEVFSAQSSRVQTPSTEGGQVANEVFHGQISFSETLKTASPEAWRALRSYCTASWGSDPQSPGKGWDQGPSCAGTFWNDLGHSQFAVEAAIGFEDVFPEIFLVPPITGSLRGRCQRAGRVIEHEFNMLSRLSDKSEQATKFFQEVHSGTFQSQLETLEAQLQSGALNRQGEVLRYRQESQGGLLDRPWEEQLKRLTGQSDSDKDTRLFGDNDNNDNSDDIFAMTCQPPSELSSGNSLYGFLKVDQSRLLSRTVTKVDQSRAVTEESPIGPPGSRAIRREHQEEKLSVTLHTMEYRMEHLAGVVQRLGRSFLARIRVKKLRQRRALERAMGIIQRVVKRFFQRQLRQRRLRRKRAENLFLRKAIARKFRAAITITRFIRRVSNRNRLQREGDSYGLDENFGTSLRSRRRYQQLLVMESASDSPVPRKSILGGQDEDDEDDVESARDRESPLSQGVQMILSPSSPAFSSSNSDFGSPKSDGDSPSRVVYVSLQESRSQSRLIPSRAVRSANRQFFASPTKERSFLAGPSTRPLLRPEDVYRDPLSAAKTNRVTLKLKKTFDQEQETVSDLLRSIYTTNQS